MRDTRKDSAYFEVFRLSIFENRKENCKAEGI